MNRLIIALALIAANLTPLAAQTTTDDASADNAALRQFEGNYLFCGTNPTCEAPELAPDFYYECAITAVDDHLQLTGFIGNVDNEAFPCYTGTYHPDDGTITFHCGPDADGESVTSADFRRYYLYDFTLHVSRDAEGRTTLTRPGIFYFYAQQKRNWLHATYNGLTFTKDAPKPVWNGNINYPDSPTSIDDLLCYTLEFENAYQVAATGFDVMGFIFDAEGQPYAIAVANGTFDAYGSATFRQCRATIRFVRIADLTPQQQQSARATAPTLPKADEAPASATVVFAAKSFKVDGRIIDHEIVRAYHF